MPHRVLAGRYRLIEQLGRGGMGVVWHARDDLLNRDIAIKEIHLPYADTTAPDVLMRRAMREAQAAARLRHPGIVTVHDVVTEDGRPWIVMALIRGRSLAQEIESEGPLPGQRVAALGLSVLDALSTAHRQGILHRDVKPANILLDGDRPVLTDFGIASIEGATALTATGQIVGSPDYLAPERITGHPPSAAVDLWGLGVTLYTAAAGRTPFHRGDIRTTLAAILASEPTPLLEPLWPAVRGLLDKNPVRRLTAEGAARLLEAAASPEVRAPRRWSGVFPARSRPEPTLKETLPDVSAAARRPRLLTSILIVAPSVALLAAILTLAVLQPPDDPVNDHAAPPATSATVARPATSAAAEARISGPAPAPTPTWTPPALPPGYNRVSGETPYLLAVPKSWEGSDGTWRTSRPGATTQVDVRYLPVTIPTTAKAEMSFGRSSEERRKIRTTGLPKIEGASSVAQKEVIDGPMIFDGRYFHMISRVVVTADRLGVYWISVYVAARSSALRDEDWQKNRATLLKVLNSFVFIP